MKLAPLLAQFLYTNKRLDLPGIGVFLLDPSVIIDQDNNKQNKQTYIGGITFDGSKPVKEAPELIQYISAQTGKMKALAAADLDSHLELAHQFINIGKPFLFEGIGSLMKLKSGQFAFSSGEISAEKINQFSAKEINATSTTEESFHDYKGQPNQKWRKPAAIVLIFAGIGLAIWGGYTVYKKTTEKNTEIAVQPNEEIQEETTVVVPDTSHHVAKDTIARVDTTAMVIPPPVKANIPAINTSLAAGNYKFVVEVADKQRGLLRFGTLKKWGLDVKMETADSTNFKLFFILPANAADTARIIDSLGNLYTPYWAKGFVEK